MSGLPAAWRGVNDSQAEVERLSGQDMVQLASDVGPAPWQVAAVLRLEEPDGVDQPRLADTVARRCCNVRRLRQQLVKVPTGCGRPIWVDDPRFEARAHVSSRTCPAPGDEDALLDLAAELVVRRLPAGRPLWQATIVTGLVGPPVALVVVFHHVLADGIGGLAVLGTLVDGAADNPDPEAPLPVPRTRELLTATARERVQAIRWLPRAVRTLRAGLTELRAGTAAGAPRTSLNVPTGPRRRLAVARADLQQIRQAGHQLGATVNDVVLSAVGAAASQLLHSRGESAERLVVSVPVSGRGSATPAALGNQVGVMAVEVPLTGSREERLHRVAAATRAHRTAIRGTSAAVLGPAIRLLSAVGALRPFINRQRLVNVYETNLRGPDTPLSIAGRRISDILPVSAITGNISLSFAVLSYAGRLSVLIVADPDHHPDLPLLRELLQAELTAIGRGDLGAGAQE